MVELLVVIAIITLLAGMLLPALGRARLAANRSNSEKNLVSMLESSMLANKTENNYFDDEWNKIYGLHTANGVEPKNTYYEGNNDGGSGSYNPIMIPSGNSGYERYSWLMDFAGKHPMDPEQGRYSFFCRFTLPLGVVQDDKKTRFSAEERFVVENYRFVTKGDRRIGVAFGDAHVRSFEVPTPYDPSMFIQNSTEKCLKLIPAMCDIADTTGEGKFIDIPPGP